MREKHGQYNQETHLPNNRGQAVGSGLVVQLYHEVQAYFPDLFALAQSQRLTTAQLVARLEALESPEAQRIVAEYQAQRSRDALARAQRDCYTQLRALSARLATCEESAQLGLQQQIQRLQRQIEKAELQHGALLTW